MCTIEKPSAVNRTGSPFQSCTGSQCRLSIVDSHPASSSCELAGRLFTVDAAMTTTPPLED